MSGPGGFGGQRLVEAIESLQLRVSTRRSQILLRYGGAGLLVGFLLGGVFGAINRDLAGAIVGSLAGGFAGMGLGLLMAKRPLADEVAVVALIEVDDTPVSYAPGALIKGYVRIRSDGQAAISSGSIALLCNGRYISDHLPFEGAGRVAYDRQETEHHREVVEVVPSVRLRRDSQMRFPFEFTVPVDGAPTCMGFGVRVMWSLEAEVLGSVPIPIAREQVFVESVPNVPGSAVLQSQTLSDAFLLTLTLPDLVYAEGEQVSGQVQVTASEPVTVSELRVMLLRVEYMELDAEPHAVFFDVSSGEDGSYHGDRRSAVRGTTYVWIERSEVLATRLKVGSQLATTLSFGFPLNRCWRPSIRTPEGLVKWRVAVVASRIGHKECRTGLDLVVHTALPRVTRVAARGAAS